MYERLLITTLRKNLKTRIVGVETESAIHLDGKFAVFEDASDRPIANRWNATGFIGVEGEERIGIQLDVVGNNNGTYNARLGNPDDWENYVEDNYIYW